MNRFLLVLGVVALLAGCGSSVKLDQAPVEDRVASSATPVAGANAAGSGAGVSNSGVTPVDIGKASEAAVRAPRIIYFDYDSFVIKPEFQSVVEAQAKLMLADKTRKFALEGHTDERGGREYNLALGQKRAEAVRRALGLLGVPDNQVEAVSFGKEKPAALGSDEDSLAKNRRVEISNR